MHVVKGGARLFLATSAIAISVAADAGETTTYTYDALGRLSEPNASRLDVPLGDVIGVASAAVEFARSADGAGVTAMAIGSKTHALGLALASLSENNMEVICRTPASYRPINVRSSGKHYVYEIEDRFDPCSYI